VRFIARWIALGGGIGLLPKAPGTWGALLGLSIWALFLARWPLIYQVATAISLTVLGAFGAGLVAKEEAQEDPSKVVGDEIVGQMVALMGHTPSFLTLSLGFFLFRALDIFKPFPIRHAEKIPGGWGIMADDLVAGILANILIYLLAPLFHHKTLS